MIQRFECKTGGSNKFYEFETVRAKGRVTVNGYYGAIGKTRNLAVIYDGDDETEAQKALNAKIAEKLKKRYLPVIVTAQPSQSTQTEQVAERPSVSEELPIIWPMAAQGIKDESQARGMINDPSYFAQEKVDGERCIIFITTNGLRIFSRSAGVADPTRPLEKKGCPHLNALQFPDLAGTILDSELLDGKLVVFDILQKNGKSLVGAPLQLRIAILESLKLAGKDIVILPYARTTDEKEQLLLAVTNADGEGLMFKHRDGLYEEGGRPKRNWYKLKKSGTWDCVIMGFTNGKGVYNTSLVGSIVIGQYKNGTLVEIGKASGMTRHLCTDMAANPGKYLGRVVTVRGQQQFKSGAIRHPQFNGFRDDKQPTECVYYPNEQ